MMSFVLWTAPSPVVPVHVPPVSTQMDDVRLSSSLQVLALMLQLMGSRRAVSDRFYRWVAIQHAVDIAHVACCALQLAVWLSSCLVP